MVSPKRWAHLMSFVFFMVKHGWILMFDVGVASPAASRVSR